MKRGMVQYKSEKCPCGRPISTHSFDEYQRCLHPEVRFVSIADRLTEAAARGESSPHAPDVTCPRCRGFTSEEIARHQPMPGDLDA